jgi:hypothetical protein
VPQCRQYNNNNDDDNDNSSSNDGNGCGPSSAQYRSRLGRSAVSFAANPENEKRRNRPNNDEGHKRLEYTPPAGEAAAKEHPNPQAEHTPMVPATIVHAREAVCHMMIAVRVDQAVHTFLVVAVALTHTPVILFLRSLLLRCNTRVPVSYLLW